ncbi:uncharacterized protein LOC128034766 [Gossypium raimondii]|uniref:uncharacterized protein LOC128034766 n=1 Tax=Gossypium raimondii TaxID=29730 RepID=UPI00227D6DDF|nr:uncharacterized protein LOC128034766 [Gossypium raimondii]
MAATEYERCVHFEDGLRENLRVLIALQRERDFSLLVEKAKITEEVKHAERQNYNRERAMVDYGRHHQGMCWRRTGSCLRCGSLDHHIRECPLRVDQMQAQGTGTAQPQRVEEQPARGRGQARGGNGSTHSYIASNISGNLGIPVVSTSSEVTVLSPLGQSVRVSKLYRDAPLEVQGTVFLANLMELPFGEFDMILGMDWLVKHRVNLDCATKRVVLRTEEGNEVVMIGEHRNYLANMISAVAAEKLVRKRCETYLAYVSVSSSRDSTVKDIRTVREFLDVFPEELLSLPSNWKVEFGIEIFPGTAPVSIAPYRMTPKELTELKAQIQELLDRGFIHPSVSL